MNTIKEHVQVNLPIRFLEHHQLFLDKGLNPEVGLDAIALDSLSADDLARFIRPFHEQGRTITIHGPFMDLSAGSPDEAIRDVTRRRLEQLLAAARIMRPVAVVCHAGFEEIRYGWIREQWLEHSVETWRPLGEALRDMGSRLVLENVYEQGPAEMAPLLEQLAPSGVGFCLDTGHHAAFGSAPLASWLSELGPHLAHLHLHDNNGDRDAHLPPGRGSIDFTPLWQALRRRETLPVTTLEPHRREDLAPSLTSLAATGIW